MYDVVQNCKQCGANLTLDDMRATNCKYCGTVFPHHSQAAQHAEMAGQMMNQMMAQQAQIQNQWRAGYGFGPNPHPMAPPMAGPPGGPPPPMMIPNGPPPIAGAPGGPPPMMMGAANPYYPGSPYADPRAIANAHMASSAKLTRNIMIAVVVGVVGVLFLTGGIVAFALLR